MQSTFPLGAGTQIARARLTGPQIAAALLVCAAPLALLLFSTEWFFTSIGYIDPWHYVGFFHFYDVPEYSRGAYKLARLPWILIGWLVHQLLPSLAAAMTLHAIFLVAATAGMFTVAWLLFGSYEVALLGALIVGFHPAWHGSGGWDYHNTAAGAFYLWSLAALTVAARRTSIILDGLAGAVVALAIHCNITYGCFLPILGLHYLVLARVETGRWPRVSRIVLTIGAGISGAVVVTAVLSSINLLVGREAQFFRPLLEITLRYTKDTGNLAPWWHPWSTGWYWLRYHLALPTSAVILSPLIWWLASRTTDRSLRAVQRLVVAEFVIMAVVWSAWQFAGNLTLDWDYFFFPLLPHVMLTIVALLSVTMGRMHWGWVGANALLLLGALAFGIVPRIAAYLPLSLAGAPIVAPTALFVVAAVCTLLPSPWRMAGFAVLFSVANAMSSGTPSVYSTFSPCHITAATYRAIVESAKSVATGDTSMLHARLWFNEEESTATTNGCPISLAQFGYSLAGFGVPYLVNPFPMPPAELIPGDVFAGVASREDMVVIPSGSRTSVERFLHAAALSGIEGVPAGSRRFTIGDAEVDLTLLRMRTNPDIVSRTAALPGLTLAEWTSNEFMGGFGVNTYAVPRREVRQRQAGGDVLYLPATPQDHLASGFITIPPAEAPRSLVITATVGARPSSECSVIVQDQNLNVLGDVPCGKAPGEQQTLIKLAGTVKQVRIYFHSRDDRPIVLPQRITITEHEGVVAASPGTGSPAGAK